MLPLTVGEKESWYSPRPKRAPYMPCQILQWHRADKGLSVKPHCTKGKVKIPSLSLIASQYGARADVGAHWQISLCR